MKPDHDLARLFEYAAKDEWSVCLEAALGDHFGPAMLEFDLEHEDIVDLLGEHWAMTLWGCAFEDLLTRAYDPDGMNLADDYLERRGWRETPGVRAYVRALRNSFMSVYEVSEVKAGQAFLARDLVRGGEPVLVSERSATRTLAAWDRIAARIVSVGGKQILTGGLLPFTLEAADRLIEGLREAQGQRSRRAKPAIDDDMLRPLAPLFTTAWLFDVLPRAMGRDPPRLHNSDGDEVVFYTARLPMSAKATPEAVVAKLDATPELQKENSSFWNWLGSPSTPPPKGDGRLGALQLNVTIEDGAVVLGNVELKDRAVMLSVNSAARAVQGTAMLQGVLMDLVRAPLTEIETIDHVRESSAGAPPSEEIPPEVARGLIHAMLDKQYRATLDEPVPMLGNRSPRQAARTRAGREKLVSWLKFLENQSGGRADPADPMATYDFAWLWRELGVENLRR